MLPAVDPAGVTGAGEEPAPGSPGPVPVRPLTFRELLDLPFALIQTELATLAILGGGTVVVAELVVALLTASVAGLSDGSDTAIGWTAVLTTLTCAWMVRAVLRGTVVPVALGAAFGHRMRPRAALEALGTHAVPVLTAHLVFTLVGVGVLALGVLLITVPFLVVWLGYLRAGRFPLPAVLYAEAVPYRDGVARTKVLASGSQWRLTGLWLVQRTLFAILAVPLIGLAMFVSDISGTHMWPVIVLLTSMSLILAAFAEIVESCSRVAQYIDARCRREGMDIRVPAAPRGGRAA
ncbi:hypothetical protein [Nocardia higoensis]|uniref:hypothetical protein n=1 Tax=Nocardia higoensis TaxID=228599 RepID=UPI0002F2F292|nr:hypothetical protein [Nocardia higoensis]